jgi:lipopolysaccharide/colanic/teichoic acid biosynthesis glycosyltransferase
MIDMNSISRALRVIFGIAIAAVSFLVMATVGIAFVGLALIVCIGAAIAVKLSGRKPVIVSAPREGYGPADFTTPHADEAAPRGDRKAPRVWNDGRGTIIDM